MQFLHTYQTLPESFYARVSPESVPDPKLIIFNDKLACELNLNLSQEQPLADWFSGNTLPDDASPIAQAYAGHQFGYLNQLGDGRAVLLGEVATSHSANDSTNKHANSKSRLNTQQNIHDIQLKGSGRTPFSRTGDGKACLAPMLREYLMSEAMHALNIPTSRSLAVVATGETIARMTPQHGAVLTRVASSHIRVGTFVYASMLAQQSRDFSPLRELLDYTITRHYPELLTAKNRAMALLDKVIEKQAECVAHWCRVGFIHGVMNTDNVTISGETIDYGPCAFMDSYDESRVFSSIDEHGRYAFGNQAPIMQWNMARFAESLLPLINDNQDKAIEIATHSLDKFAEIYEKIWGKMLCAKIGLAFENGKNDKQSESNESRDNLKIAEALINIMQAEQLDYTNTFRTLTEIAINNHSDKSRDFSNNLDDWLVHWKSRLDKHSVLLMQSHNPVIIPRNHHVERALHDAESCDFSTFHSLLDVVKNPYGWESRDFYSFYNDYQQPPNADWARTYRTFCGT